MTLTEAILELIPEKHRPWAKQDIRTHAEWLVSMSLRGQAPMRRMESTYAAQVAAATGMQVDAVHFISFRELSVPLKRPGWIREREFRQLVLAPASDALQGVLTNGVQLRLRTEVYDEAVSDSRCGRKVSEFSALETALGGEHPMNAIGRELGRRLGLPSPNLATLLSFSIFSGLRALALYAAIGDREAFNRIAILTRWTRQAIPFGWARHPDTLEDTGTFIAICA